MKKVFLFLMVFLLVFQIALAANTFTVVGKVKEINTVDNYIVLKVNRSILAKFTYMVKQIFNKDSVLTNEYRVNVMNNTKIEDLYGKADLLENIKVGDTISITGFLISEMTNKDAGLIEATYIKTYRSKRVVGVISRLFFRNDQTENLDTSELSTDSNNARNNDGSLADSILEKQKDCVGYGNPIVINTIFAPKVSDKCCTGLKEVAATLVPYESKTVTIGSFEYTIKGYCYNSDGIPKQPIVFKDNTCISEGEPILGNTLLAPKMPTECCKDLQACSSAIGDNESIVLNGYAYVIKGYCRKECPAVDYTKIKLPFGPEFFAPKVSLFECTTDRDCCIKKNGIFGANIPCEYRCEKNKCVDSGVGLNLGGCTSNSDCSYNGTECVVGKTGILNSMISLFTNNVRSCKCDIKSGQCTTYDSNQCNYDITCPNESMPVCGVDGKDYSNPCEAIRCNTKVQCSGECPCKSAIPTIPKIIKPGTSIGQCSISSDCEACGLECFESTQLDQLKASGKKCSNTNNTKCDCLNKNCIPKPPVSDNECEEILKTVCGNNGKIYANECEANKAGTTVKCLGACPCDLVLPPEIIPIVPSTTTTTVEQTCTHPICGDGICHPWEKVGSSLQGTCYCLNDDGKTFRFKNTSNSAGHIVCTTPGININFCKKDCFPTSTTTTSTTTTTTIPQITPPPILPPMNDNPAPIIEQPQGNCTQPSCGDGICHDWEKTNSEYQGTCMCNISSGMAICTTGGYNTNYCPSDCGGTTPPTTVIPPTTTTTSKPSLCTLLYDPVCGSDGNIYSNDCFATSAGVNYICKFFTDLGNLKCQCN